MSEGFQGMATAPGGNRGGGFGSIVAPTRPRKRIYDSEVNSDEELLVRRSGHYGSYHETKGAAPYKKAERMARYNRRPDTLSSGGQIGAPSQGLAGGGGGHASGGGGYDPDKSPMMEDEDVNQGLADNFDDSLCGLGSDLASSTYNMSEALHALPPVPPVKREAVSPRMDGLLNLGSVNGFFDEGSNSIDKLLKLITNDNNTSFEGNAPTHLSHLLAQSVHTNNINANATTFRPSPSEDALSPPSPPPQHSASSSSSHHHPQLGLHNAHHLLHQHQQQQHHDYLSHHHQQQQLTHQHSKASSPDLEDDKGHRILGLSSNSSIISEDGLVGGPECGLGGGETPSESDSMRGPEEREEEHASRFSFEDAFRSPMKHASILGDDNRFQYILNVPTSSAVKKSEDSLSYLNQGQAYEIKIKKLGDITKCAGRKFTSKIRICFHERRFQYVEREQLSLWQQIRPNDRIIEVDVPLSFGICDVQQSKSKLAVVQFDWDPNKDVTAYIKVNCISTEFTQRKHGGEKGVPFRIQIETYVNIKGRMERLSVHGCQIKVFKLKGADRKHKQDRDKISKLPACEREKYQEVCECTILSTYTGDMIYNPDDRWNNSTDAPCSQTDFQLAGGAGTSRGAGVPATSPLPSTANTANTSPVEQRKMRSFGQSLSAEGGYSPAPSAPDQEAACGSSGALNGGALEGDESAQQLQDWLALHRFSPHAATFANFTATDILRLSRAELIQICGMPDGIRLFNALHAKSLTPRATLYVCTEGERVYTAVYLERSTYRELVKKLAAVFSIPVSCVHEICLQGPRGILVKVTDEVVGNFQDECLLSCSASLSSPVSPSASESKPFANGNNSSQPSYSLILKVQPNAGSVFGGASSSPAASSGLALSTSTHCSPSPNYSSTSAAAPSHLHNAFGSNTDSSLTFGGVGGGGGGGGGGSGSSSGPASLVHSHSVPAALSAASVVSSPPASMQNFGPPRTSAAGVGGDGLQTSVSAQNLHPSSVASKVGGGARGVPPSTCSSGRSPPPLQTFAQSTPSQLSTAGLTRTTQSSSSSISPISSGGLQHQGGGGGVASFYTSPTTSQGGSGTSSFDDSPSRGLQFQHSS